MHGRRWLLIGLLALLPGLLGAAGDRVQVELLHPAASPYSVLRYEVVDRGQATSGTHRRVLAGTDESLHGATLFTKQESAALWKRLRALGALKLQSTRKSKHRTGLRWRIEVTIGGKTNRFDVTAPLNQRDRRYWHVFSTVRDLVQRRAGALPFRNVYFPAKRGGWLHIRSIPSARVFVDGVDTKLMTPLFGYRVSAGPHIVELRAKGGIRRAFPVRVKPQEHTRLNLDLR